MCNGRSLAFCDPVTTCCTSAPRGARRPNRSVLTVCRAFQHADRALELPLAERGEPEPHVAGLSSLEEEAPAGLEPDPLRETVPRPLLDVEIRLHPQREASGGNFDPDPIP